LEVVAEYPVAVPPPDLPEQFFDRVDTDADAHFYRVPRFVQHIDDSTIAALTAFYREQLPAGARLLDLMSSWVSHLPEEGRYQSVTGLGMNEAELGRNRRLDAWRVHDLNRDPELPFDDASFDAVLNAVSVQYLTRPVLVFASIARVLKPGGSSIVAMSHRCFPTKAIRAFHGASGGQRLELAARYHELAGGFEEIEKLDRSPEQGDPLWIVRAARANSG
jgi:SAM-dependent methyltransferase